MTNEQRTSEEALNSAFVAADAMEKYLSELLAMTMALDDRVSGKAIYPISEVPPAIEDVITRMCLWLGLLQKALADLHLAPRGDGK